MRAQSDQHDGHGYETVTTAPHDTAQLACVARLTGNLNATYYAPVVTWPGCLEFTLFKGCGGSWNNLESDLSRIVGQEHGVPEDNISFVDGEGPYRPEHPMLIIGSLPARFPGAGSHVRLRTNWPLVGTYGYRYEGRAPTFEADQPDQNLCPILAALDTVVGLDAHSIFVHPNDLSLTSRPGHEERWLEITADVLRALAPILGFEPGDFEVHELQLPNVEPEP
jgi:hypothetical protein